MAKKDSLAPIRARAKKIRKQKPSMTWTAALKAAAKQLKGKKQKPGKSTTPKNAARKTAKKVVITHTKQVTVGKPTRRKPASHDIKIAKKKLEGEIGELYGRKVAANKKSVKKKLQKQIVAKSALYRRLKK